MATSSTSSLGFRYHRQKPEGDVAAGSLFQLLPIPRLSSQRRTAAEINAFVRVNFADARTVSSAAALSGDSGVCSSILKFVTDRTDDGSTLISPLLRAALFGSQYKVGAPIVDSRVLHRPVTNEWLKGYILETFSLPCSILAFSTLLNGHAYASACNIGSCLSSLFRSLLSG